MAGMYGADVAQLRALAAQFDRAADQLEHGRTAVGSAIRVSAWVGPSATSFRSQWDSEHSVRIAHAARSLRDGAHKLRANAEDQERASAVDGGPIPGLSPAADSSIGQLIPSEFSSGRILELSGTGLLMSDLVNTAAEMRGLSGAGVIGRVLGPLGLMVETADIVDRANIGDSFGAARHSATAWLTAVAIVVPPFAPMALGFGALNTLVDWSIPTTPEQQDATLDKGAEILFGSGVSRADLSPEQADGLTRRYSGIWGPAYMISDTIDATADRIFPWNWGK